MGVTSHNDATIAYCQQHNITYEAYGAMKGCPFTSPVLLNIAHAHNASTAQVCLRWVLDRGCVIAVGTGSNSTTVPAYTKEDLDILKFTLTPTEVEAINKLDTTTGNR
jgi:diketogulonate reductase-like aldo/keto reductase